MIELRNGTTAEWEMAASLEGKGVLELSDNNGELRLPIGIFFLLVEWLFTNRRLQADDIRLKFIERLSLLRIDGPKRGRRTMYFEIESSGFEELARNYVGKAEIPPSGFGRLEQRLHQRSLIRQADGTLILDFPGVEVRDKSRFLLEEYRNYRKVSLLDADGGVLSYKQSVLIGLRRLTFGDFFGLLDWVLSSRRLQAEDIRLHFIERLRRAKIRKCWSGGTMICEDPGFVDFVRHYDDRETMKAASPFVMELWAKLAKVRQVGTPIALDAMYELANGVVLTHDSTGEFNTYYDDRLWASAVPVFTGDSNMEGVGLIAGACIFPRAHSPKEALASAKEMLVPRAGENTWHNPELIEA